MAPPSKRSEDRLGHAHKAKGLTPDVDKIEVTGDLRHPEPNPAWIPIAVYAWEAFLSSPLSQFYTETDLAYGWMTAQAVHSAMTTGMSAMKLAAADSMMRSALFNEADRRRVRIELTRKEPEVDPVAQKNRDELRARRAQRDAG